MGIVLLRTTIATLAAWLGAGVGVAFGKHASSKLNILVYAAMGVLLAVTLCDILPDARASLSVPAFIIAVATGYALFWQIGRSVYHLCPSCAFSSFDDQTTRKLGQTAFLLMLALGVHSTMDGVAVAVGSGLTKMPDYGLLFAVSFHKLPEGMALALILIAAGFSPRTALIRSIAIEATTELGGLVGVLALKSIPAFGLSLIFAHIGGGFLYLVATTLGASFNHVRSLGKGASRNLALSSVLGFLAMASVLMLLRQAEH